MQRCDLEDGWERNRRPRKNSSSSCPRPIGQSNVLERCQNDLLDFLVQSLCVRRLEPVVLTRWIKHYPIIQPSWKEICFDVDAGCPVHGLDRRPDGRNSIGFAA